MELSIFLSVFVVSVTTFLCCVVVFGRDEEQIELILSDVQDLQDQISALKEQIEQSVHDHDAVVKLAEETKKMISETNLAMGFRPRGGR